MPDQASHERRGPRSQRLPRNQQRERVLRLVREGDGAVDAGEIAGQMGLHITTVRFHLDALCEEGAVARTRIKRDGVGRPRTGYVAVRDRLDYRSLAEILALELGDTVAERRERAERAGERWAGRIIANATAESDDPGPDCTDSADDRADMIAEIFERMGFGPELAPAAEPGADGKRERTIRLHGCPVRDLARTHPEVSCGMHVGLLRGLLHAQTGAGDGDRLRAELDPFVEPELCIARVVTDD
ncbi:transcriptional regulator [Mycobacterium sp. M1]|uniref:Transcriptional regulator n=1 Tax=Mycolicibacter acidiphilus TaxID=2835306 RepID=A0ABS5RMK6_9MYCO|nr:transcriptional regulator [Mycolicibacter acidiphilus]MBS9535548.1 transcriptional regulator [Mycolicibacter acidiphilus]